MLDNTFRICFPMKKLFLFLLLSTLLLQGCSSYKQISLEEVEFGKMKITALTKGKVNLTLKVNNPTRSTFKVTSIDGYLMNGAIEFAKVSLPEEFQVKPGTPATADVQLEIEVSDPLALLTSGLSLSSLKAENFTVDAYMTIKKGAISKRLKIKDVPLRQLMEKLNL